MKLIHTRHAERAVDLFAKQFAFEGGRWTYRRNRKEAPVAIEENEAEHYVEQYRSRLTLIAWGTTAAVIGTTLGLSLVPQYDLGVTGYVVSIALEILFMAMAQQWAWNQPARDLDRRPQVGVPLTSSEYTASKLGDLTYQQLLYGILAGAGIAYGGFINLGDEPNFWWLWLGVGMLAAVFGCIQLLRKYLLEGGGGNR